MDIEMAISPLCKKTEIVGSIRRNVAVVGDIEILAVPRSE